MYHSWASDYKMTINEIETDKNKIQCPRCQLSVKEDSRYCPHCSFEIGVDNTSGTGYSAIVPEEIKGLNWGAFFIPVIWGIFNFKPWTTEPWISDTTGLAFLGGGFITLAVSRILARTKLVENGSEFDTEK